MKRIMLVAGTLLILAVGLIFVQYRSDLAAARRELRTGSQIAHTACGPVEYAVAGSGPAVLIIHGAGGGYSQVAAISELLATSGFKAIAMSRFGYLRTPLPADASPAAQADAHACLLDALGVSQAAAVGLSAGAPSAIQYSLRHPARCSALVLLVPAISVPGRHVAETTPQSSFWQLVFDYVLRSDFVIWVVTRIWPEMLVETVLATPLEQFRHAGPAERQRGLSVIRDIFPVSLKADGLRNDALVTTTTTAHHLERISTPTLAISAKDDLYRTDGGAKYVAERIPGARLILFPTGGHAWLGHDAEVRDELLTFLRGATSSQQRTTALGRPN
jgi:pimeloyl-ACP methyl ester carboxylesterase